MREHASRGPPGPTVNKVNTTRSEATCRLVLFQIRGAPKTYAFSNRVRNGPSKSSKVVDFFGTNRKQVFDFLLVINSKLGPILPRFRDIIGFFAENGTPPYSTLIFADVGATRSEDPKLITRVTTFKLTQPIRSRCINVTDIRTNGRLTVAILRNAHTATRGNKFMTRSAVEYSVFTAYIMLFISDNCRLHIGQVVFCDKLIIR